MGEDEEEDDEEEEAYKPRAKKRGAPTPRKEIVKKPKAAKTAKAKAKPVVAKKSKPAKKGAVNKSEGGEQGEEVEEEVQKKTSTNAGLSSKPLEPGHISYFSKITPYFCVFTIRVFVTYTRIRASFGRTLTLSLETERINIFWL